MVTSSLNKFCLVILLSLVSINQARGEYIYIDLIQRKLHLKDSFTDRTLQIYPIAVGRSKQLMTPPGEYAVFNKTVNPGWLNPFGGGRVEPGHGNPLGTRWIGFHETSNGEEYGIHGTYNINSVGRFASHGCVRMRILDIEQLFNRIDTGDPVIVNYERLRITITEHGDIALKILSDPYRMQPLSTSAVIGRVHRQYPQAILNIDSIENILYNIPLGQTRLVGYLPE